MTCGNTEEIHNVKFFYSSTLKESNLVAFLTSVGSKSHSTRGTGNKYDLIRLKYYFSLLKPKTDNTLQWRSKPSCKPIN